MVTIGIPNYNYGHYIIGAIESAVNQTYRNIELIIVDDCSTDNSVETIETWIKNYKGHKPITFIRNKKNLGLPGSCSVILNNTSGKYFQTLDADDILFPDKISRQVNAFNSDEICCLVYSNANIIDENGHNTGEDYLKRINYHEHAMPQGNIFKELFKFNFIPLPSVLINTQFAKDIGGYDNDLQVQDYYLWLKLSEKHPVMFLPGLTASYRVHSTSMSNNEITNLSSIESVLRIKYRYYKSVDTSIKKIIKRNIHFSTAAFYKHKYSHAGIWLKRDLMLNPGLKSFIYFMFYNIGIPFTFLVSLKKLFQKV